MDDWRDVTAFCAEHHGVIDNAELDRLGVPRWSRRQWVVSGRLERAAARVWRLVGSADTWRQRLTVGTLSLGHPAAASHDAAARLHRFDRAPEDVVEFLVPTERRGAVLPFADRNGVRGALKVF